MEEPLLAAVVSDETETTVSNQSLDGACRHPTSPWARARVPKGLGLSKFVPVGSSRDFGEITDVSQTSSVGKRPKTITAVYPKRQDSGHRSGPGPGVRNPERTTSNHCFTLTVMTSHAPGSVLCRSSPSCRASLCLPGV